MNGAVDELNGPTWFMNDKEYTLDYVCANERGLQCVKGAKILGIEEVVESQGVGGVSTPPEFWMGGLNTCQPPLILRTNF